MLKKKVEAMADAITLALIAVKNKAATTARELKADASGMEIIQVVMIVAISVLAVAGVWVFMKDLIIQLWQNITGTSTNLTGLPATPATP